jgi:hypothetical protein
MHNARARSRSGVASFMRLDFEGLLRNLTEKLRIFVLPAELISCASQIMQP